MKKGNRKLTILLVALLMLPIAVLVNLIGDKYFSRADLTQDARFTVSDGSKQLLRGLDGQAVINVYYAGDMPTYYKNLQENLRTFLSELRYYADGHMDFFFVDPKGDRKIFEDFASKHLDPFPVVDPVSDVEVKEQFVLPYAEITYKGKTEYVNLIKGCVFNAGGRLDFDVFKAMRNSEYNLMSTLFNMTRERTKTIGILTGHEPIPIPKDRLREYYAMGMSDLYTEMDRFYNIVFVDLNERKGFSPQEVDVLMVIQPETEISLRDQYEIDQYLMRGGKVFFMMDHEIVDWSIGEQVSTMTSLRRTGLGDMFMKWGVILNGNIVQDINCGVIDASTYTSTFGSSINAKPWVFNPRVLDFNDHPIARNLSYCLMRFAGSIDTTATIPGINKQVLMRSSRKTRVLEGDQYINVDQVISQKIDDRDYNRGMQTFSILLSGKFESNFVRRKVPLDTFNVVQPEPPFVSNSADSAKPMVAMISDGEFAIGEAYQGKVGNLPGDNKAFVLNLLDLMSGQDLISSIRVREVTDRKLDKRRIENSRGLILLANIVLPIVFIILFGLVRGIFRRSANRKLKVKD